MPRKAGKDYGRPRARSKTRSNKPKLVDDTEAEEKALKLQLATAGLYCASTIGDGNCLFRALSDQLTGSDSSHADIRHNVCEHLSQCADRYRLFVDSDSVPGGYEGHVGSMRRLGTYGTNIELSAFANLYQRSIKVIQPGLTYVIQAEKIEGVAAPSNEVAEEVTLQVNLTPREARLKKRQDKLKAEKGKGKQVNPAGRRETTSLYIVYHSWEHYSSVRRLAGPHTGLPRVELLQDGDEEEADALPKNLLAPEKSPPTRPTRGRPRKLNSASTSLLAQSVALPPSIPPSPATTPPPPLSDNLSPSAGSGKHRPRSQSLSESSGSGGDHHISRKQRSRRPSPTDSADPLSPATSIEADELSEEEDDEEERHRQLPPTKAKGKTGPVVRPRRGPTAREKKELARKRKVELRKARGGASAAEKARGTVTRRKAAGAGEESVLMEVKELFI